jgi:hypothetical protein
MEGCLWVITLLMMKFILLFTTVLFLGTVSCLAQTKTNSQLSLGVEYGVPVGSATDFYGTVLGASAKLELPVQDSPLRITVTAGLTSYIVRLDENIAVDNLVYAPVEVGAKYYFSKIGYFEGDLGASANLNSNSPGSRVGFIYAPIIGISAPTNKHKATIDLGLRYGGRVENGNTLSQIALRVAYRFKL